LINILEQDHRTIKKRIGAKLHCRRFDGARRTIQGYATIHKLRKGQVRWLRKVDVRVENEFIDRIFGLRAPESGQGPELRTLSMQLSATLPPSPEE
jgi:hypothetical protein